MLISFLLHAEDVCSVNAAVTETAPVVATVISKKLVICVPYLPTAGNL